MAAESPDIHATDDWRAYMGERIEWLKASDPTFSIRRFARDAGLGSHASVLKIIREGRNPGRDVLVNLSRALKHSPRDHDRFMMLALGAPERRHVDLEAVDRVILRDIHVAALVGHAEFRDDPAWIARMTGGLIPEGEADEILTHMKVQGALARDEAGTWVLSEEAQSTIYYSPTSKREMRRLTHAYLQRFVNHHRKAIDGSLYQVMMMNREESQELYQRVAALIDEFHTELQERPEVPRQPRTLYWLDAGFPDGTD